MTAGAGRLRVAAAAALALSLAWGQAALAQTRADRMDRAVLAEINAVRADPRGYADSLRNYEAYYHGAEVDAPGQPALTTVEGVSAVDEAIGDLERRTPAPALGWSDGLANSAIRLAADIGPRGRLGHVGSDGSTMPQRIRAAHVWAGTMAENISFGARTAQDVVRQLVIDDNVPGRGHRTSILDPGLSVAGVACGPHAGYGWMCVIDFAGALMPPPGSESRQQASR